MNRPNQKRLPITPIRSGPGRGSVLSASAAYWCVAVVLGVATGCNPSTVRPGFAPFLDADVDTLGVLPAAATTAIASHLREDGYRLKSFSVIDRFIQTAPRTADSVQGREARVTIRIWADPATGGRSRITTEVVFDRIADPSRIPRDREQLVRYDHPTRRYVRAMLRALREELTP